MNTCNDTGPNTYFTIDMTGGYPVVLDPNGRHVPGAIEIVINQGVARVTFLASLNGDTPSISYDVTKRPTIVTVLGGRMNTKSTKMSDSEMWAELARRVGSTASTEIGEPIIPVVCDALFNVLDRLEELEGKNEGS